MRGAVAGAASAIRTLVGDDASAQTAPPAIVPREQWGGDACPPRAEPAYGEVKFAFIHHTVSANDYGPEDSAAMVLGICRYHRNSNGWNDIGYNFLVDRYGTIFEGRAGGIAEAVVGAQAQGYNSQSTGIASLGTFSTAGQTEAGLRAIARLLGWKLAVHGVPPRGQVAVVSGGGSTNRYPAGSRVHVRAHLRPPRRQRAPPAPATACTPSCPAARDGRPRPAARRHGRPPPARHAATSPTGRRP